MFGYAYEDKPQVCLKNVFFNVFIDISKDRPKGWLKTLFNVDIWIDKTKDLS